MARKSVRHTPPGMVLLPEIDDGRKHLSADALLTLIREGCERILDQPGHPQRHLPASRVDVGLRHGFPEESVVAGVGRQAKRSERQCRLPDPRHPPGTPIEGRSSTWSSPKCSGHCSRMCVANCNAARLWNPKSPLKAVICCRWKLPAETSSGASAPEPDYGRGRIEQQHAPHPRLALSQQPRCSGGQRRRS